MYPEAAAEFAKNPYSTKMHKELQAHLQLHSRHRAHSRRTFSFEFAFTRLSLLTQLLPRTIVAHEPPEYWEMGASAFSSFRFVWLILFAFVGPTGFPTDEVVARVGVASEKIRRDERLFMESEAE